MNKRIFTLFMGALLLLGSTFTVSAQVSPIIQNKPTYGGTFFSDTLRADTAHVMADPSKGAYYLLSVTDIANPTGAVDAQFATLPSGSGTTSTLHSTEASLVMFLNNAGELRIDTIKNLDDAANSSFGTFGNYGFNFGHNNNLSRKFGAMRQAQWCVKYYVNYSVQGSNAVFDFTNMATGELLEAPLRSIRPNLWSRPTSELYDRWIYKGTASNPDNLDLTDNELIVSGWHFSQTYYDRDRNPALQTGMPLFSYVERDSVLVLVIDEDACGRIGYDGSDGGWRVTVKQVAVSDLIKDAHGNVRLTTDGPNAVHNVLLFTLKKLERIALNADEFNAINTKLVFNPDAKNFRTTNDGWNPFTEPGKLDPHGNGYLKAYEVEDSLYRYGYMQFARVGSDGNTNAPVAGQAQSWLYVDTAFWNYGEENFLRFNYSDFKRDTMSSAHIPTKTNTPSVFGPLWGHSGDYYTNYYQTRTEKPTWHVDYGTGGVVNYRLDSVGWAFVKYFENLSGVSLVDGLGEISNLPIIPLPATGVTLDMILNQATMADAVALWDDIMTDAGSPAGFQTGAAMAGLTFNDAWALTNGANPGFVSLADMLKFAGVFGATTVVVDVDYLAHTDYMTFSWAENAILRAFHADSAAYLYAYHADSIMENQSKFRVVYDPFEDSTFINVYQSRVRYTNFADPHNPVDSAWWTNSYRFYPGAGATKVVHPSNGVNAYAPRIGSASTVQSTHSFLNVFAESSPKHMDIVMISTADTVVFNQGRPWSHIYKWNTNTNSQSRFYQDSLIYVDIQNLEGGSYRIATIDQAKIGNQQRLDTRVSLGFASCNPNANPIAEIGSDLYLIRNASGQYLAVPIWSIMDSAYWITPEKYEDPTQIPSYQWVVENKRAGKSPFRLTNREFEGVSFDYVSVLESGDTTLIIGDPIYRNARFTQYYTPLDAVYPGVSTATFKKGEFAKADNHGRGTVSFLRLDDDVKQDQLLGYTYIDPDSAIVDIYAFKYYHFLATGAKANYLGWNGYDDPEDTIVFTNNNVYLDRLYFRLEEMPYRKIGQDSLCIWNYGNGNFSGHYTDYSTIYDKYGTKYNNHVNSDSLVLEKFGYMPTKRNARGETVFDYGIVRNLKPLARQAYRLMLKDYYYYHPTIDGDYMTVGEQDNYVLSDRKNALKPYSFNSSNPQGIFGVPYFYFRNTYFQIPGVNLKGKSVNEDYFALVQRLDTVSMNGFTVKLDDVKAYLTMMFTPAAANKVAEQIEKSNELGAFIALVEDYTAKLKIHVRGDAAIAVSGFTLERDDDPIYRRFHWNDWLEETQDDTPLTLSFHRMLNPNHKLFENSGGDRSTGGGYEYNLNEKGELYRDSLGKIISFLGIKNDAQFPEVAAAPANPHGNTNYSFYVDTAYINRGTGWIKPQYMLVVDHKIVTPCSICEPGPGRQDFRGYVIGRYMYNTSMYAKQINPSQADSAAYTSSKGVNYDLVQPINTSVFHSAINGVDGRAFAYETTKWERIAFAWAIHRGDSLFVLKNVAPYYQDMEYDTEALISKLGSEYGGDPTGGNIDFDQLIAVKGQKVPAGKTIGLHAIIDLGDNTHKDWVWSFRYNERYTDNFVIESETTDRDRVDGPVIRPGWAGWIKYQNNVPVITRADTKDLMVEAEAFNVTVSNRAPVSNVNPDNATDVKVIAGNGTVTILNAAGKNVIISNILGQTLVNTKLNSDNASISLPAGVAVVVVEGESAVKAVVK